MRRVRYKVILTMVFTFVILLFNQSISSAASANISASSTNVSVGDNVSINVVIDAATWNVKVNGAGVSDSIVGFNSDAVNQTINKSYNLDTSKAGSYTVSISGDVTDATGNSSAGGSVTVNVVEKANQQPATQQEPVQQQTQQQTQQQNQQNQQDQQNQQQKQQQQNQQQKQQQAQPTQPNFTNTNQKMYTTGNINLRSSWSISSQAINVPAGTEVTVTGTSTQKVEGYVWYRILYNGQTKYVASNLLTSNKPEEKNEKSSNKALKDIVVENYKISPAFNPETTKYQLEVGKDVEKLGISAIKQEDTQKVDISGNENFKIGNNIVKVTVTAEDGTTRLYTITVVKTNTEKSEEAKDATLKLSQLTVNNATLDPKFDANVTSYTITVNDISSVKPDNITATPADEGVTVTVAEENKSEGVEKNITIMLENADKTKTAVYQITVKKSQNMAGNANQNGKNNSIYYILGGIIFVLLVFIIIIIILLKRTSDDDFDDEDEDDELSDDYNISLKDGEDGTASNNGGSQEYDEMIKNSNVKSHIVELEDYDVFKDKGDGVGVDRSGVNISSSNENGFDDDGDKKNKRKGKHF